MALIRTLIAVALMAVLASAATSDLQDLCARELIVKWKSPVARLDAADLLPQCAGQVVEVRPALPVRGTTTNGLERITVVTFTDASVAEDALRALAGDSRVEYAELRPLRHTHGFSAPRGGGSLDAVPDDPYYSRQWGLTAMEAEAAWNITRGDPSVVIAVVDLGVDFTHPELSRCQWVNETEASGAEGVDDDHNGYVDDVYGYDFVDIDGDPTPNPRAGAESHGTHVAGLIAAERNNGRGIAGLAPDCRVMGVRSGHTHSVSHGYDGIYYACVNGARIINCSWGGYGESAYENDVLSFVFEQGCIVIASAGNDNTDIPQFPASIPGVVSVAATAIGDVAAYFTNFGSWVQVSAPGVDMVSTIVTDGGGWGYDSWQGTSMAAPMVAAACGLVASRWPDLGNQEIISRVLGSADPLDRANPSRSGGLGLGRVNAWRALVDTVSGLRLGAVTYEEVQGNGDGRLRAGETARLRISVFNDLTDAGSVAATVATDCTRIASVTPTSLYDNVTVGGPFWNSSELTLQLSANAPNGAVLPISVDWTGTNGRLLGRGFTLLEVDSTYVPVDNGRLCLGLGENGSLGYADYVRGLYLGPGLRLTPYSNALYHGSFVLAADGVVSDNFYGDTTLSHMDWAAMPDSVAHRVVSDRADVEGRAAFDDRLSVPEVLFARVEASVLGWNGADENGFLILEYRVNNHSVNAWNQTYAGLLLDIDLGGASSNRAGFDASGDIAYVWQISAGHPMVGFASVSDPWGSLYVVDNRNDIDPPRKWSDSLKWELLERGMGWIPSDPKDISLLLACDPVSIAASETRTFTYAIVVGDSVPELRVQAALARARYVGRVVESQPAQRTTVIRAGVYPNPLAMGSTPRLVLPNLGPATVRFYNILGQLVAEFKDIEAGPQGRALDVGAFGSASGLLLYRIQTADGSASGKLLLLR